MEPHATDERLSAFYDGELPPPAHREVEQHLARCAACRTTLASWRRTAAALFPIPAPRPTETFVQRVMARLGPPSAARRPRRTLDLARWWAPALEVAAAMAVLALVAAWPWPEASVSTEALLLADGRDDRVAAQLFGPSDALRTDDLLTLVLEGGR